jgi:hypothetical protein
MATCVPCHDGKKASSTCSVCHLGDTSEAVRVSDRARMYPRTALGRISDCGGCHDQTSCDKCHGLRMPHSATFTKWQHARYAAFSKRESCWGCHVIAECGKCHSDWARDPHGPNFRITHRRFDRESLCACHWSRMPESGRQATRTYCALCH